MLFLICLASLAGLLVIGALIDIDCRRLPNWLTSSVAALYGVYVLVSPEPVDWLSAFIVAGLVFALGFAAFAFRIMGGGDVKLMSALSLWAGVTHIADFLIVTSLAGGALAILMLTLRRWAGLLPVLMLLPAIPNFMAGTRNDPLSDDSPERTDMTSLPYGVAIAAGGFAVIYALLQL